MSEIIGRIEKLEKEEGNTNGKAWTRFVLHLDGKKYGTFNADVVEGFKPGDNVKLTLIQKGKFTELVKVDSIEEKISSPSPVSAPNNAVVGVTEGISKIEHTFQSSYEFGPAGNRHTIKYNTIEELKSKIKELEEAGLTLID